MKKTYMVICKRDKTRTDVYVRAKEEDAMALLHQAEDLFPKAQIQLKELNERESAKWF